MPSLLSHLQRGSQDFYGRKFEDNYEMPPNERLEAACRGAGAGDIEAVREWLATTDDVNALNVAEPAFGVAGRYGRNSTVLLHPRARDDGRPRHEVHLRAGGQRDRLERPIILAWRARAPVLSTSIVRGDGRPSVLPAASLKARQQKSSQAVLPLLDRAAKAALPCLPR